jgi:thiamine biosynthesis lipoprotein
MEKAKITMGMPARVEIVDPKAEEKSLDKVFDYFTEVDERFSTYKPTSEITLWNEGKIKETELSKEMQTVLELAEKTKKETDGFFDIVFEGVRDPSGLVKGWAIHNAAEILRKNGYKNFYVEIGGDIEVGGKNGKGEKWGIGIRNPFNREEVVKVVYLSNQGIATSGTAARGLHIYNPKEKKQANEIASITVIGPNIYEADRFATAAFAMGKKGIEFIENLAGLEGYMIDLNGIATYTSGFAKYTYA